MDNGHGAPSRRELIARQRELLRSREARRRNLALLAALVAIVLIAAAVIAVIAVRGG
jgi:hypothetical protein